MRVSKCLENYLDKCNTYNSEKILHTAFQLPGYQIYQTVSVRLSDHYKTTALKQTRYIFKPNDKKITFTSHCSLPKPILKAMKYLINILGLCNF